MANYRKIKNYFRKDGKFNWGCQKKAKGYPIDSIDVYIKELKESLGIDYAWTVVSDDDNYEDSSNHPSPSICLSSSHKFVQIYDPKSQKVVYEEIWPLYSKVPEEVQKNINEAKNNGMAIKQGNAWDPKIVSKEISDWVWKQTGFTVDFNFDPSLTK